MDPLDYAEAESRKLAPLLGRVGTACLVLSILVLFYARYFASRNDGAYVAKVLLAFALFAAATIVGLVAVIRPTSRTRLAWITLSICIALWFMYVIAVLAGR
jgi:hypothetical protein